MEAAKNIQWSGKPAALPFAIDTSAVSLLSVLVFLGISAILGAQVGAVLAMAHMKKSVLTTGLAWLIPLAGIGLFVGYRLLIWSVTSYEIFTDRIVISDGLIGRDMKMVPLSNIQNISVNVGIVGRITGTGDVRFFSGEMETSGEKTRSKYDVFEAVSKPYELLKLIEEIRRSKNG